MKPQFQTIDDVINLCDVWIKFYRERNPEGITFHEMVVRGIKQTLEEVKESRSNKQ